MKIECPLGFDTGKCDVCTEAIVLRIEQGEAYELYQQLCLENDLLHERIDKLESLLRLNGICVPEY